ncbi:unnamed protein product [Schistocephalus solidus]|uniref:Uncharacterized protein n=1 Tax=Schistocephalus solidus TaxID=70667 RepID=A0A183S7M7_SCHSO|nr:unnamed protein product [Schistocephalus solidus]
MVVERYHLQRFLGIMNVYVRFLSKYTASPRVPLMNLASGPKGVHRIDKSQNEVVNALFKPSITHFLLISRPDLIEIAAGQRHVGFRCNEDVSRLKLLNLLLITGDDTILCNVSTASHHAFLTPSSRREVLSSLHSLSHPGSRTTVKVSGHFVSPGIPKNLKG